MRQEGAVANGTFPIALMQSPGCCCPVRALHAAMPAALETDVDLTHWPDAPVIP